MKEEVREFYSSLVNRNNFRSNQPIVSALEFAPRVQTFIETAEAGIGLPGYSLRPDAKALLLLNFVTLVAAPLIRTKIASQDEVLNAVASDISMLVRSAAQATSNTEISAHTIVDQLSRNWKNLKTNAFNLWE